MKYLRERALMGLALVGIPALIGVFLLRPVLRKSRGLQDQIRALQQEYQTLPRFTPLTREEVQWMGDPTATWRGRIPVVQGDRARLAHYHRVVSELQDALRRGKAPSLAMRSQWAPIQASFTLPSGMAEGASVESTLADGPEFQLKGWVLEAQIPGETGNLFRALSAASAVGPLLEPVGLRWEITPASRRQHVMFRNLVLTPSTP